MQTQLLDEWAVRKDLELAEGPAKRVRERMEALRETYAPSLRTLRISPETRRQQFQEMTRAAEQARKAGFDVAESRTAEGVGGIKVTMAPATVGGVGYELIRFG